MEGSSKGQFKGKGTGKGPVPPPPPKAGYKGGCKGGGTSLSSAGKAGGFPRPPPAGGGGAFDFGSVKLRRTDTRVRQRDGTIVKETRSADGESFYAIVVGKEDASPQYVLNQEAGYSQLEPKVFDASSNRWVSAACASEEAENDQLLERRALRIVTYNVWFSEQRQRERAEALFTILEGEDADIVCLQEVTLPFLSWLRDQAWVREGYTLSDAVGTTLRGTTLTYGVVMLLRQDLAVRSLRLYALPTMMNRAALVAVVPLADPIELRVATVHLESLNGDGIRANQLDRIFQILGSDDDDADDQGGAACVDFSFKMCVLAGDMNFDDGSPLEEAAVEKAGFVDCWKSVGETSADGFTMPFDDVLRVPTRIDRVFLRSRLKGTSWSLVPSEIRRIGMDPIDPAGSPSCVPCEFAATKVVTKAPPRPSSGSDSETDPEMPELIPIGSMPASLKIENWKPRNYPSDHYGLACQFAFVNSWK